MKARPITNHSPTHSSRCVSANHSLKPLLGRAALGSCLRLSVMEGVQLASSFSIRSFTRLGKKVSVLNFLALGSTLSVRSSGCGGAACSMIAHTQLGSALSVRKFARVDGKCSALAQLRLGSSSSLRKFIRLGSTASVFGRTAVGSVLKLSVINVANVSINSHVNWAIAKALRKMQGDLFIIYLGNNEMVGLSAQGQSLADISQVYF